LLRKSFDTWTACSSRPPDCCQIENVSLDPRADLPLEVAHGFSGRSTSMFVEGAEPDVADVALAMHLTLST